MLSVQRRRLTVPPGPAIEVSTGDEVQHQPFPNFPYPCYGFFGMKVTIRATAPDELDEVLSVLDEAGAWLHAIGITQQCPLSFSGREGTPETFTDQLNAGIVYLACIDDAAVGTFRLTEHDARVWPEAKTGEALYLHSLAVRRSVAGSGVATEMLTWARARAASLGMQELRLDCWAGNQRLRRYYTDAGFEFRGERTVEYQPGRSFQTARFAITAMT